jgi:hypothetical protein
MKPIKIDIHFWAVLNAKNEVLQETEQVYDNAGNVIATVTTELSATSKKNFSRKQFTAAWCDPMGRVITTAPGEPPVGYAWLDKDHRTDVLTVWRTLNVECDAMYIPSGMDGSGFPLPYSPGNTIATAPVLGLHLKSEFERACITVSAYTSNLKLTVGGPFILDEIQFAGYMDWLSNRRDSEPPTASFWTAYAVGAFCENRPARIGSGADNFILIYNTSIETQSTSSFYKEIILLHELGHLFGLVDNYSSEDIMRNADTLIDQIESGWISFTTAQISSIQAKSMPD